MPINLLCRKYQVNIFLWSCSVPVPVVSLEKIPNLVKADGANVKMNSATTTTITSSSASSSTIPAPTLVKSGLTSKSVPPSPEKILNGRGIVVPSIDKKHQNGTKSSNKPYKRLSGKWCCSSPFVVLWGFLLMLLQLIMQLIKCWVWFNFFAVRC